MGREATCKLRWRGENVAGRALLETDELIFRGQDLRLKIARDTVKHVSVVGGAMRVVFGDDTADFELGEAAAKWAEALVTRKSRLDKLGVAPGQVVSVVGISDETFHAELAERVGAFTDGALASKSDLVFLGVNEPADLAALALARKKLAPTGGVWVVRQKGKTASVTEGAVRAAAHAAGLVDVKVAAFSATHTGDKFVIPVADRTAKKR